MTDLLRPVHLAGTGAALPGEPIGNAAVEALVGPLPPEILDGLQVRTRHWIIDPATGEHRDSNSGLAHRAVCQALERAGVDAADVDLVVTATASPDYLLPPMATFLADRLGLRECATLEVRSGCAGFVEALDVARLYLERGLKRTAVVVGSETISPLLVPLFVGKDPQRIRMRDRMNPYNFGDGAGAVVLTAGQPGEAGGISGSALACVGGGRAPGMQLFGAGGTHAPLHQQLAAKLPQELRVDLVESGKHTPHVIAEGLRATLAAGGVAAEAVDLCVLPEGNAGYLTGELAAAGALTPEWLAVQPKIFENLALVGATGSAAVPLALDHAWVTGAVARDDVVALLAIETSKWKYGGTVLKWTA
ncbi:3-oxoacyl-ACP synthase III family protein [Amycolatopsis sp. NPDC026612]|uniref:3-oxoacyl-ACP synthase III family protein n=1 Tax=Amycolatopsis sp. NPDC026612 TaxID=3155466 RepID=UPI0033CD0634